MEAAAGSTASTLRQQTSKARYLRQALCLLVLIDMVGKSWRAGSVPVDMEQALHDRLQLQSLQRATYDQHPIQLVLARLFTADGTRRRGQRVHFVERTHGLYKGQACSAMQVDLGLESQNLAGCLVATVHVRPQGFLQPGVELPLVHAATELDIVPAKGHRALMSACASVQVRVRVRARERVWMTVDV